ncbi:LIM domain only protein 7b isoform X2 [Festucalex cinctus]
MEWRQQSTYSCADAFNEAQRWIEEVTGKSFGCSDFRAALENGVLLCDLINQLKPGIIKKLNRLATPIAGLDNINVFLKACGKLGLNESQLFHPGDLQDLSTRAIARRNDSSRRLKNVLITVYWLGRKAYLDDCYNGAHLNFKAFEGLLGLALSKSLDEGSNALVKDGAYQEGSHQEGKMSHKRENSVDSLDSADSRAPHANSEGCGSDAEAEEVFRMETTWRQQPKGDIPPPLLRSKQKEQNGKVETSFSSRSKSLSDIPTVYPSRKVSAEKDFSSQPTGAVQWSQEKKWRSHSATRDSEVRWQDALTKWKNHRKNTKSNLRRKSVDREHVINKMTDGAVSDLVKKETHHSAQLERDQLSAQRHSPAPHSHSTSPSKFSSFFLRTHRRAPLARSYATEVHFSPASSFSHHDISPAQAHSVGAVPASDGNITGAETHFASLALNGAAVTTPTQDNTLSSQTQFKAQDISAPVHPVTDVSQPEKDATQISSLGAPVPRNDADSDSTVDISAAPFRDLSEQKVVSELERHESPSEMSGDKSRCQVAAGARKYLTRAASWSCSASLPRGFKRSEGSCRLSSVVTPRPFGTKQAKIATLYNVNDNQSLTRSSEGGDTPSPPASATLKRQTARSYLRGGPVQAVTHVEQTASAERGWMSLSDRTDCHQLQSQQCANMQRQHSAPTSLPSSASVDIAEVDHRDMKICLAPLPTSRPNVGFQHWEASQARVKCAHPGGPAEPCQLCADDEIPTVDGDLAARMSSSPWEEKMTSALQIGTRTMDVPRYEKKGGSESAISDLQVPSLTPSSSSWSWDLEGDHKRQQKWQEEQERLLRVQYERDQQRLEAEWQKAKRDAIEENNFGMCNVETPPGGIPPHGLTKIKEHSPEELGLKQHKDTQNWAEGASGFAQLSLAHRAKSMSTPALSGSYKQPKDDVRKRKEESLSKAELERQQILEEMKKRTQLLTDNSWIRQQRSSTFYKEPIYIGTPLKRYESLDTLGTPRSTFTTGYPRPHSAAAGYCGPSRNSSTRSNTGWRSSQRKTTTDSDPGRIVSGRRTCCMCGGHLSSGAAMVIEALSLCFHFACFQCVGCQQYLGKTDTAVQVRVRNKKPYCEPCYFQLKSTNSTFI